MEWHPATVEDVRKIVRNDLAGCDEKQLDIYKKHAVEPYTASILRYGVPESVIVVARKGDEVIYWEDVEEGFNLSPIGPDGRILQHWCNQDELGLALDAWIEGRARKVRLRPAEPVK